MTTWYYYFVVNKALARLNRKSQASERISVSQARVACAETLLRVATDTQCDSGDVLDHAITSRHLPNDDARFATALVFAVLRNQTLLDEQVRHHVSRSLSRMPRELRILLRMAAAQHFLMTRVPDHAIVNETVSMARSVFRLHPRDVAFANACARRVVAQPEMFIPSDETTQQLSVRFSHPEWLLQLIRRKFGEFTGAILAANNVDPPSALRANTVVASGPKLIEQLQSLGIAAAPGELSPDAVILPAPGDLGKALRSELFARGWFYVQDEASQLVAVLANPMPGERVLDLCAAPGGKTTHMASLARCQARIEATDLSVNRLRALDENVKRLGISGVSIMPHDEVLDGSRRETYDLVLVDAPCSGLGTLRRHPEIRYRVTADDVSRLAENQLSLLRDAGALVKPGGRLVYSTCSITDEENISVVEGFLKSHPAFELTQSATRESVAGLRCEDGLYRTWPRHLEVDGFEAAVMRRR